MNRPMTMNANRAARPAALLSPRLMRALLAGIGAGVLAGSVPAWLLEAVTMATGIASVFPPAAPPLGLTARLLIAIAAAAVAIVLVWTLWRQRGAAPARSAGAESAARPIPAKPSAAVAEPVSGGLMGRIKSVLGGRAQADDDEEDEDDAPLMSRRRADRHPDAPPRPPLVASRDLPAVDALPAPARRRPLVSGDDALGRPGDPWVDPAPRNAPSFAAEPVSMPADWEDAPPPAASEGAGPPTDSPHLSFEPAEPPMPDVAVAAGPLPLAAQEPRFEPEADLAPDPTFGTAPAPAPWVEAAFEPEPVADIRPAPALAPAPIALPVPEAATEPQHFQPTTAPAAFLPDEAGGGFTLARTLAAAGPADSEDDAFVLPPSWSPAPVARSLGNEAVPFAEPDTGRAADLGDNENLSVATAPESGVDALAAPADPLPPLPADNLAALAARFEAGIARREAIGNAAAASRALQARIALADQDDAVRNALRSIRPLAAVPDLVPAPADPHQRAVPATGADASLDQHVDMALEQALGTLRKLSELGRR